MHAQESVASRLRIYKTTKSWRATPCGRRRRAGHRRGGALLPAGPEDGAVRGECEEGGEEDASVLREEEACRVKQRALGAGGAVVAPPLQRDELHAIQHPRDNGLQG